jgi:hypothetical protein
VCAHGQVNNDCDANNDAESAAAFFGGMCAPGAADATAGNSGLKDKLCSACEAGSSGFCEKGADKYSDYDGALRCLVEGAGDVAFVKHTTLPGARALPLSVFSDRALAVGHAAPGRHNTRIWQRRLSTPTRGVLSRLEPQTRRAAAPGSRAPWMTSGTFAQWAGA